MMGEDIEKNILACPICGKTLGIVYYNKQYPVYQFFKEGECKHYRWEEVGNGCYPFPQNQEICKGVEELKKVARLIFRSGTTYYFLVPTSAYRKLSNF